MLEIRVYRPGPSCPLARRGFIARNMYASQKRRVSILWRSPAKLELRMSVAACPRQVPGLAVSGRYFIQHVMQSETSGAGGTKPGGGQRRLLSIPSRGLLQAPNTNTSAGQAALLAINLNNVLQAGRRKLLETKGLEIVYACVHLPIRLPTLAGLLGYQCTLLCCVQVVISLMDTDGCPSMMRDGVSMREAFLAVLAAKMVVTKHS